MITRGQKECVVDLVQDGLRAIARGWHIDEASPGCGFPQTRLDMLHVLRDLRACVDDPRGHVARVLLAEVRAAHARDRPSARLKRGSDAACRAWRSYRATALRRSVTVQDWFGTLDLRDASRSAIGVVVHAEAAAACAWTQRHEQHKTRVTAAAALRRLGPDLGRQVFRLVDFSR
jgi:hypothetical protein